MIGIDIVEIRRLREMDKYPAFLAKVFNEEEINYLSAREPYTTAAGLWAAKEAVVKALGSGFTKCSPKCVKISHDGSGRPWATAEREGKTYAFEISISHERDYAVAVAMLSPEQK